MGTGNRGDSEDSEVCVLLACMLRDEPLQNVGSGPLQLLEQ
jgi:hypothetical protein